MTPAPTTPRERPIIMSEPMIRAIQEGRKTQTRRIVKPMPGKQSVWLTPDLIAKVPHGEIINGGWQMHHPKAGTRHNGVDEPYDSPLGWIRCPYGAPGSLLYVKETWLNDGSGGPGNIHYRANATPADEAWLKGLGLRWKSPRFMPRKHARILLKVESVRVERLQSITESDAMDEGMGVWLEDHPNPSLDGNPDEYRRAFAEAWNSINGAGSWNTNPYVWVVGFKVATP